MKSAQGGGNLKVDWRREQYRTMSRMGKIVLFSQQEFDGTNFLKFPGDL